MDPTVWRVLKIGTAQPDACPSCDPNHTQETTTSKHRTSHTVTLTLDMDTHESLIHLLSE